MVNLREEREKAGLTQEELAKKCKITRTMIAHIEAGRNLPSVSLAKRIGKALDFSWVLFFN